jgi:hypothetical protein
VVRHERYLSTFSGILLDRVHPHVTEAFLKDSFYYVQLLNIRFALT